MKFVLQKYYVRTECALIRGHFTGVQVNFGSPPPPVREGDTITISVVADRDFTAPFTVGILAEDSSKISCVVICS